MRVEWRLGWGRGGISSFDEVWVFGDGLRGVGQANCPRSFGARKWVSMWFARGGSGFSCVWRGAEMVFRDGRRWVRGFICGVFAVYMQSAGVFWRGFSGATVVVGCTFCGAGAH